MPLPLPGKNFTPYFAPPYFAPANLATVPHAAPVANTTFLDRVPPVPQPSKHQRMFQEVKAALELEGHRLKLKEEFQGHQQHVHIQFQEMAPQMIPDTLSALPTLLPAVPEGASQTLVMDFSAMAEHGFNIGRHLELVLGAIEKLSESHPNAKIELDLSGCGFNTTHAKCIEASLRKIGNRITSLRVSNNPIAGLGVNALFDALRRSSVEALEIDKCNILYGDLQYILSKLSDCTNLKHLSMRNNGLDKDGMNLFALTLKGKTLPLEFLSISHNRIGSEGFGHLSKIIASCPQLERLEAHGCIFDDRGVMLEQQDYTMRDFAKAVARCEKLEALMLGANPGLWDSSLAVVVDFALKMRSLKTLDISQTSARHKTAAALQSGLPEAALKELNVNYCGFAEDEVQRVLDGVARSSSMEVLKRQGI